MSVAGCVSESAKDAREAFTDAKSREVAEAIMDDDGPKVSKLVQKGANVNAVGLSDRSLLEYAVWRDKHSAFEALLNAGADTAHADAQGERVLHYAARSENPIYVTELLGRHLDPNVATPDNRTPIMLTALFNRGPQMHALIAAGANLEVAEVNGDTALIIASESNSFDRVIDLLHAGANPLAGHRIKGKPDVTFQGFVNMTPEKVMSAAGKQKKAEIRAWLEAHNVPVEQPAQE
jgi:uncharacterized protein